MRSPRLWERAALLMRGPSIPDNPLPWEVRIMSSRAWLPLKGLESVLWWVVIIAVPLGLALGFLDWPFYALLSMVAFAKGAATAVRQRRGR